MSEKLLWIVIGILIGQFVLPLAMSLVFGGLAALRGGSA